MTINYLAVILLSFFITFAISIPFIRFLYKFNIRRLTEVNLDEALPERSTLKLGTPIMGGTVIIFSVILFTFLILRDWEYFWMIVIISCLGGIVGAIDEYTNALGRTLFAIRKIKSTKTRSFSYINKKSPLFKVKNIIMAPWKMFEECIRVMGSNQRGVKGHYKFLMHLGLSAIVIYFLVIYGHTTVLALPLGGTLNAGIFYYIFLAFLLVFFANAFGITDGLDGLSAGTHAISFGFLGILSILLGYKEPALLAFIIAGAELAFLYFNIKPARMQMSDVGTVPLGMLFVIIAFLINSEYSLTLIGALFIVEILSSVGQQWSVKIRKKKILLVAPIHHHFEKLGWSENKIVERFWLFTAITGLVGLFIALL
jgi:phospho-N-acetylmuramoyl-pentapeptide-transferase